MKFKHKKLFISGTAVAAAGALGVGAFLQTALSVQASSEMMPGIETIVSENTEDKPFKILELVDNSEDAEIGYYISGQEPTLKLYEYQYTDQSGNEQKVHFSSIQEALSKLPEKYRTEFTMNVKVNDDGKIDSESSTGIKKINNVTGEDSDTNPLSLTQYQEKYFLDSGDDASAWNKINLVDFDGKSRTDTVQVNGSYQENTSGTGDYTKADQEYYPIRNGVESDKNQPEKYRENIQNFYPSEGSDSRGAYYVEFAEVSNDKINSALADENKKKNEILPEYDYANGRYGYYENVYTDLTREIADNINSKSYQFAGENPDALTEDSGAVLIQENEEEAVKSMITESNEFNSGEDHNSAADSNADAQDDFSTDSDNDSGSVDFDSAYPSDETEESDNEDADDESFDSDVSLEQQSYEVAADSSDVDTFSDDFSDQAGTADDSENSVDSQISDEEDTNAFDEDDTDTNTADQTGEDTDEQSDQRTPIGGVVGKGTAGSQENPYIYLGKNIDEYPYYQYELIGDLKYVQNKVSTVEQEIQNNPDKGYGAGDIILENDQYWYYGSDENGTLRKYPLSIVTGRQPVSYNELQTIPTDKIKYSYYYRVKKVYFCCNAVDNSQEDPSACAYFGWYYPTYPENEDAYLPVTQGQAATHYISEAVYSLTPGTGNYDFVPGGDASYQVQVNSFYYQGGYSNNDWFKKYVFHLDPKDSEFNTFGIQVDTRDASDVTSAVYAAVSGEDTEGQNITADDTASVDDAGNSADESAQNDGTEADVDFSSEYQEDTQDTDDAAQDISSDADISEETDDSVNEEEENQTDENSAADAGDTDANSVSDVIAGYDLVYVNGVPSEAVANALAESGVPCIINASRSDVTADNSVIANAFSSKIESTEEDADGHYVNTNVYFFKDRFVSGTEDDSNLVNVNFKTNFNENLNSEEDITYGDEDAMQGFEEIIKYINSENQYRSLGNTSDAATASDESSVSDGSTGTESIEPLTREISQARAIEYIINYKYKRAISEKSQIKVLEIQPDTIYNTDLSGKISSWMKTEDAFIQNISKVSSCCNNNINNLIDGNPDTVWLSDWKDANNKHWVEFDLKETEDITSLKYTEPKNYTAEKRGVPYELKLEFYGNDGVLITQKTLNQDQLNTKYNEIEGKERIVIFDEVKEVKKIIVRFSGTFGKNDREGANHYATAAELSFGNTEITSMSASEFVGHIDDIGSGYDVIYIGDQKSTENHSLVTGSGNLRYAHVGAGLNITQSNKDSLLKLLGQLDKDYLNSDRTTNKFAPYSTYNEQGAGYFRGSGNDMTKQQYHVLMDFVKSGYPVILADGLVSNGKVNSKEVDSASYYSEFISDALKYDNVATESEMSQGTKDFSFFFNLAKPLIEFDKNGGKPAEPPRKNETGVQDGTTGYIDGELKYTFTVKNDSDASPASTTYDCNLYMDLNFDGNLSTSENQSKYIVVQDESGNVLSRNAKSHYELQVGKKYTVTRKIPSDYYKIIAWKLELTSNRNEYIHTSETGYAKQKKPDNVASQTINVVQLVPPRCTWNLFSSTEFQRLMNQVDDFKINLTTVDVTDINAGKYGTYTSMETLLADKQMLIIGFADVYQDINEKDVKAILKFIQSGRSVIFAHDTTSYVNYDYTKMDRSIPYENYNNLNNAYKVPYDKFLHETAHNVTWGLGLNTILRSVTGMDRYGITSDEKIGNTTIGQLLKKGNELQDGDSVSFVKLMEYAGDVALQNGDKTKSYAQTQGYSNAILTNSLSNHSWNATKVNDGAITEYPYKIADNISIAETHGQYYQLALEQDRDINGESDDCNDVVVWYCLPKGAYGEAKNDVRNNYYFYSKGNVIYTGAGHSDVKGTEEIQLFVNAIVAAANVTAVQPQVNFVSSLNPSAETEESRYYMTDQSSWTTAESEENTLEKDMQFFINVRDYNMVSADLSNADKKEQKMTVSFYIEDSNGQTVEGAPSGSTPISKVDGDIAQLTTYGSGNPVVLSNDGFVIENNAYALTLHNVEKYLRTSNGGYKQNCKLYAKVTSTVSLYGQLKTNTSWASIDLKQRQLFEMD